MFGAQISGVELFYGPKCQTESPSNGSRAEVREKQRAARSI